MHRKISNLAAASAVMAIALGGLTACVDKEKCEEAIRVTRDALAKDQPVIARQWRDRAWKMCDDPPTVANLDKEIVDKEAAMKKRVEDEQKRIADAAQGRMNTSTALWHNFDKLDPEKQVMAQLDKFKDKANTMSEGLPEQYAKQVDEFNDKQYERRRRRVEAAEKNKKK